MMDQIVIHVLPLTKKSQLNMLKAEKNPGMAGNVYENAKSIS